MTDERLVWIKEKLRSECITRSRYGRFATLESILASELVVEVDRLKQIQRCSQDILARTRQPIILAGSDAEVVKKAVDTADNAG